MSVKGAPKVIVSVTNDLATDNRVKKICTLLVEMGAEVVFVGREKADSTPLDFKYTTHRFSMFFSKGGLFYAEFNIRLFFFLLFNRSHLLVSNDLDTLLPNYLISRIRKTPLVYDTHEYFLGVPEIQDRWVKKVWAAIERSIFPKLKTVFTVNDSIAGLYEKDYGIRPLVFRNIGDIPADIPKAQRSDLGIPKDAFVFINQGSGINVDRGMEEALEALAKVPKAHLLLVGNGDVIPVLKERVPKMGIENRVHFVGRVPYNVLLSYTSLADVGLSLDKPTNINYQFSLPNKVFDYIHRGLPVLCSKVVEVKSLVENFEVGISVDSMNPQSIASGMTKMMELGATPFEAGLQKARTQLTWEEESKAVKNVYATLLDSLKNG